jgi:predicted Zn-dependent peptidase
MFYRKTVLDNGITVMSEPMDSVRSVSLGIWFAVGSRDESPPEAGMSHFMEHMMFKGTPTRSARDIAEQFDHMGAMFNAETWKEHTAYHARFVDNELPKAFEILADMVCHANLDNPSCVLEREVVIEEIARMEDDPDDQVHEIFERILWPSHPLGLSTLGNRETVGSFDHANSVEFRSRHYLTGNTVVAAAGNLDHEELIALAQSHLGDLCEGPRSRRSHAQAESRSALSGMEKDTEQAHIVYGTATMDASDPERFPLYLMNGVLGGGMSSRLFQEIREKRGLVYSVGSMPILFQDSGEFAMFAGSRPENVHTVLELMQEETARMAAEGVTPEELDRARQAVLGQQVLGMESTSARMRRLGRNEVTGGEILSTDEVIDRFNAVTLEQVGEIASRVLSAEKVLSVVSPLPESEFAKYV